MAIIFLLRNFIRGGHDSACCPPMVTVINHQGVLQGLQNFRSSNSQKEFPLQPLGFVCVPG